MAIKIYRDTNSGKELVGTLYYADDASNKEVLYGYNDKELAFSYEKNFVNKYIDQGTFGISEKLPIQEKPFLHNDIVPFFSGLLPEGEPLARLSRNFQLPRDDFYNLLSRLGCETIGALTFVSEDIGIDSFTERYTPLDEKTIKLIDDDPNFATSVIAAETRLSLSGAQSKFALFLPDNITEKNAGIKDWLVPSGFAPSSHIIKVSRRGERELALNEYVCSLISKACGIETADVFLLNELNGAIAIKRYDRKWINNSEKKKLLRLHQEDFCQALGLPVYYKYQPQGVDSDYLLRIGDLINSVSVRPYEDRLEFVKRFLFNYIIGNTDAHLKNYAFLYNDSWTQKSLAPLYDITCIPLTDYSTQMPFDVGKHRQISEIDENDLLLASLDLDIEINDFCDIAQGLFVTFSNISLKGLRQPVEEIFQQIMDNSQPRLATIKGLIGK